MVCGSNPSFPQVWWLSHVQSQFSRCFKGPSLSLAAKLRPNHHHTAAIRVQHTIAGIDAEEDGTQQEQHLAISGLKITDPHDMGWLNHELPKW